MATENQNDVFNEKATTSTISPATYEMAKTIRNLKTFKKSWDSDKAIKSTYKGLFGRYQIRAYLFLAIGYGIVGSWLLEMPKFALLPPKHFDCTPIDLNVTNQSNLSNDTNLSTQTRKKQTIYNYTNEYGRTVLTDMDDPLIFNAFCDKTRLKIPHITYIVGLILGGLIFGYMADRIGRKMVLLGSLWTACVLSIFQLLSEDYISYVFFIIFLGITIGAVHVITIPYVMEMFSVKTRAIYGLSLIGIVFLLDLVIPWIAIGVKNWKILQIIVSVPLIITALLYWFTQESMFWNIAQKDYRTAVISLTKIAEYNGIVFQEIFREARSFLHGKRSIGIQCDFQPLLRLEDIKVLGSKYPDFDMVDLQATTNKKTTSTQRILNIITGHHYYPSISTFYPTDFLHSSILTIYLLIMCGLWLVSSLTEYSLEAPHLTEHLTKDFYYNYFYTHLIQIISFIITFPLIYKWGRRWPTFCFFLIAEVCLLGSVAVKLDDEQTRTAMLVVYFTGKFAARAAFIVVIIYTCELFPTGLRCLSLGICYTFRLIGVLLASPDMGGLNDWMPRLIYGILSLILGAMALLLPETRKIPLPRTITQVESLPTSISDTFLRRRSAFTKRNIRSKGVQPEGANTINDAASHQAGLRSGRPYDNQSTLHSVYELQDFGQDETIYSLANRHPSRRTDLRGQSHSHPYGGNIGDVDRQPQAIVETAEYTEDPDDPDDDGARIALQRNFNERQLASVPSQIIHTDDDVIVTPDLTKRTLVARKSTPVAPSKLEEAAKIQSGNVTIDDSSTTKKADDTEDNKNHKDKLSNSPRCQRAMSQNENYFSEHC